MVSARDQVTLLWCCVNPWTTFLLQFFCMWVFLDTVVTKTEIVSQQSQEGPVLFWVEAVSFQCSEIMTAHRHFSRELESSYLLDWPTSGKLCISLIEYRPLDPADTHSESQHDTVWRALRKTRGMCCVLTLFAFLQSMKCLRDFKGILSGREQKGKNG